MGRASLYVSKMSVLYISYIFFNVLLYFKAIILIFVRFFNLLSANIVLHFYFTAMNEYIEQYREYYRKYVNFLPEEMKFYEERLELINVSKKEFLIKAGEKETHLYFVLEGLFRLYLTQDNKDICVDFAFKNQMMSSFISFKFNKPSIINIQALEDSKVFRLSKNHVEEFNAISKNSERFTRETMELLYCQKLQREITFLTTSAEERYRRIAEKQPELVKAIAVKDLATYLGIHPESLSRIRKKVHRS
jgi:CRP/FNR family transcriptional regulator, anaerobic regulatory protein